MIITADDIHELAAGFAESGLAELHLTGHGADVHLMRSCNSEIDSAAAGCPGEIIAAVGAGIFLTCHPLHAAPLVDPGRRVRAGQTVALLRVGLLLRPVTAPVSGVLGAPLAEEGALVGYGTPLFPLHPEQPETQR
jgi:acetyl-CoA carboxylase biotin carboxyl carrier protein